MTRPKFTTRHIGAYAVNVQGIYVGRSKDLNKALAIRDKFMYENNIPDLEKAYPKVFIDKHTEVKDIVNHFTRIEWTQSRVNGLQQALKQAQDYNALFRVYIKGGELFIKREN